MNNDFQNFNKNKKNQINHINFLKLLDEHELANEKLNEGIEIFKIDCEKLIQAVETEKQIA
jgi:transaldolase